MAGLVTALLAAAAVPPAAAATRRGLARASPSIRTLTPIALPPRLPDRQARSPTCASPARRAAGRMEVWTTTTRPRDPAPPDRLPDQTATAPRCQGPGYAPSRRSPERGYRSYLPARPACDHPPRARDRRHRDGGRNPDDPVCDRDRRRRLPAPPPGALSWPVARVADLRWSDDDPGTAARRPASRHFPTGRLDPAHRHGVRNPVLSPRSAATCGARRDGPTAPTAERSPRPLKPTREIHASPSPVARRPSDQPAPGWPTGSDHAADEHRRRRRRLRYAKGSPRTAPHRRLTKFVSSRLPSVQSRLPSVRSGESRPFWSTEVSSRSTEFDLDGGRAVGPRKRFAVRTPRSG